MLISLHPVFATGSNISIERQYELLIYCENKISFYQFAFFREISFETQIENES